MFEVKSVDEVFKILRDNFSGYSNRSELVSIFEAVGRTIAADITANEDIPGFNRSSVDGFAVKAADTFGASDSIPAQLKLMDEVRMGETPRFNIQNSEAAAIPTGGELPCNADAVVMVEYTELYYDGFVYINKAVAPGNNVVFRGDDTKKGNIIVKKGTFIRPQEVGILSAVGCSEVLVEKQLKVGIISTGDEVVPVDSNLTGAQVRDVNAPMLYAGIMEYGAEAVYYGIVKDDYTEIASMAGKALEECDIVLISGGSSVGERDNTGKVIKSLGAPGVLVHGIAVKPGKPTIIGKAKGKAILGLPGHPASAYMIYRIFTCYLMDIMSGRKYNIGDAGAAAEMYCNYPSNNGREEFVPVSLELVDGKAIAKPVFGKSGLVSMLSAADGYVRISRSSEGLQKGESVKVIKF